MTRLNLPIRQLSRVTPRAMNVTLDLCGAEFTFAAGQAVAVTAPGDDRKRYYSLACSPADVRRTGHLELLVGFDPVRSPQALTWTRGTRLDVEGPVGKFTFPEAPAEQRFMFIAGGTGVAPLRSMLRCALARPHEEIAVIYSARSPEEFAYHEELTDLARSGRIRLRQTVTRERDGASWAGGRGRICAGDLQALKAHEDALVFICGPRSFVDDTRQCLSDLGARAERIRIEEW